MTMSVGSNGQPISISSEFKNSFAKSAMKAAVPVALVAGTSTVASAAESGSSTSNNYGISKSLGKDAYTTLGGMPMCRLLNGMWQLSGAHGFEPQFNKALAEMKHCADEGFTTFDLADHYGPSEDYVGQFSKGRYSDPTSKSCQFFTKWVPMPMAITKQKATEAIDLSLKRMSTDQLDLLQFHWWDYKNKYYYDAMDHLVALKDEGKIRNLGLTNFDTEHLAELVDRGVPLVSNQVAFSIIDTRPQKKMAQFCTEKGIKLLCYGTLMGGFVSSEWLNQPQPARESLTNVSLRKYLPWIMYWGGWDLFQEMLAVLDVIAKKHDVSISNVALRWVLDQPAVGGAIVGVRFGLKEHVADNRRVFSFTLDDNDRSAIAAVQDKGRDLMTVFGDCGGEYRRKG